MVETMLLKRTRSNSNNNNIVPHLSFSLFVAFLLLLVSIGSVQSFSSFRSSNSCLVKRNIASSSLSLVGGVVKRRETFIMSSAIDNNTNGGLSLEELERLLQVAVEASKKAGDIIVGNAGGVKVEKTKANSRDLLTLIDPLCEKTIQETVLANFPEHEFLGEEDVPPGKEASAAALDAKLANAKNPHLWIVDPIDGTSNFVHGMPLCMPSVAVAYKGEVVVGVIYDPHRDELFTAMKGYGAKLNGETIQVGHQTELGDAIVAMGSPPAAESLQMSLNALPALMPKVRTIRMLGSAALMLAWVANGRLTAYWEYDLSSWDVAAGALLVTEAGGKFTDLEDNPYDLRIRKICASNGGNVHSELLSTLHESGVI